MDRARNTESEEILEYRFSCDDNEEGDFSYNEAIMDESMADFLKEETAEPER
jgi:hypothetical protein